MEVVAAVWRRGVAIVCATGRGVMGVVGLAAVVVGAVRTYARFSGGVGASVAKLGTPGNGGCGARTHGEESGEDDDVAGPPGRGTGRGPTRKRAKAGTRTELGWAARETEPL